MTRKAREIKNLVIDEISLVDKGANQHATVTIAKSADGEKESYMDIYDESGNPLDPDALEDGTVVFDDAGDPYLFELSDETEENEDADNREPEPVGKAFMARPAAGRVANAGIRAGQALGRNKKPLGAGAAGFVAGGAAGASVKKNYGEELREELSKALSDSDRDAVISKAFSRLEEMSEAVSKAQAAAEEEREIRLTQEYTEIAKSYDLPIDEDVLGGVLMRCAEALSYEDCEVIGKALEFASDAAQNLFAEYGSVGGGDNSDVLTQVNALVDGNVAKSNASREAMTAEIFAENPDAYDQYLAERY